MPDWSRVLREIRDSLVAAAREEQARQKVQQGAPKGANRTYEPNQCLFWSCQTPIRAEHIFCYAHLQDLQDGLIDECPGCGKAKSKDYELCIVCNKRTSRYGRRTYGGAAKKSQWYKPEYSEAWEKADAKAERFFAYILKLEDGRFYAGQTRELRERISEHRDGRVKSTAGRNPKLVWFTSIASRESATALEVELKKLVDSNPREIRRMMLNFQDLVRELDFG